MTSIIKQCEGGYIPHDNLLKFLKWIEKSLNHKLIKISVQMESNLSEDKIKKIPNIYIGKNRIPSTIKYSLNFSCLKELFHIIKQDYQDRDMLLEAPQPYRYKNGSIIEVNLWEKITICYLNCKIIFDKIEDKISAQLDKKEYNIFNDKNSDKEVFNLLSVFCDIFILKNF